MSYFIIDRILKLNQQVILSGEEAFHLLKSRRIQPGELIEIQDSKYQRFQAKIESITKRELLVTPVLQMTTPAEPSFKIHLFQALIKDKALELVLQKTTELGVASICLFQSVYSQRLKKDVSKQLARWNRICLEACKQSGRTKPPQISFCDSIMTTDLKSLTGSKLVFSTSPQNIKLTDFSTGAKAVSLLIGPEGGWQEEELNQLQLIPVNLGPRILRSETAAILTVGLLQFLCGDMAT